MNINDHLIALRQLMGSTPDETTWRALCGVIDAVPDAQLEIALDYVEGHLARWPDELRLAPERWWSRRASGQRASVTQSGSDRQCK